jgi:hypothetical protein
MSPHPPAAVVFSAEEGIVESRPTATNRSRLTLIPRDEGLYIPLRTCETSFPPELIRVIAEKTPFASLCDAIARHEDPAYVSAVLLRQLFSYFAPADFAGNRLLDIGCGSGA